MEISNKDLARECAQASIQDNSRTCADSLPSRSDLVDVVQRLPTREELTRIFRDLNAETMGLAVRSMEKHLSVLHERTSDKLPSTHLPSSESEGSGVPDPPASRNGEERGANASEQSRNAAAASMAQAICEVHEKPVRLARKASEYWDQLDGQVRTDVLRILLAYEATLSQMISTFDDLGG